MKLISKAFIGTCALVFLKSMALAKTEKYIGRAEKDGKPAYIERHTVEYGENEKLISAETVYEKIDGSKIAILSSDFRTSLTVPTHTIKDFRSGETQGLRREGENLVLFFQEKDQPEEKKILSKQDSDDRVMVGCQGLNYYLLKNLTSLDPNQTLPLRFLIPGKLDYYDFDMKQVGDLFGDIAEFEITVKNWFLKIFAPTLRVKYDKKLNHIIWYEGISNIKDDSGKNQKVSITYSYSSGVLR